MFFSVKVKNILTRKTKNDLLIVAGLRERKASIILRYLFNINIYP